jgi:hypothetical protein
MVFRCPGGDRNSHQLITFFTQGTAEARRDTAPVSTRGKERTMLNTVLGMMAMLPVVFAVAAYAMVSR